MSIIMLSKEKNHKKKIPLIKAWFLILSSAVLISGSSYLGVFYYQYKKTTNMRKNRFNIVALTQSTTNKESLQSEYLAELLNLSFDQPTNLYHFNVEKGVKHLLRSPLIKSASIRKVSPGSLHINYSLRKPVLYSGDITNTAVDDEGVLIPFQPFFTPKTLPLLVLGEQHYSSWQDNHYWGLPIESNTFKLVMKIVKYIEQSQLGRIEMIDLSRMNSGPLGNREVILSLIVGKRVLIRLSTESPFYSLDNYKLLVDQLTNKDRVLPDVIDLRILGQALLKK